MLHKNEEEAVATVISYLQNNPTKYPAIGHLSLVIANELSVAAAIVHIASKRITLGLASLEPEQVTETELTSAPGAPFKRAKKQTEESEPVLAND